MSLFALFCCFKLNSLGMIKWDDFLFRNPVTLFDFASMDSVFEFLYPKLILFVLGCWSSVSAYLLPLLHYLTRFAWNGSSSKGKSGDSLVVLADAIEESSKVTETNMELVDEEDFLEFSSEENDGVDEKEAPEVSFTFKFPTFEEFSKSNRDYSHLLNLDESSPVSKKNFCEVSDQSEVLHNLEATEVDLDLNDDETKGDFEDQKPEEKEDVHEEMNLQSSIEKKIGEVDETEEIDTELQKFHQESVSSCVDSHTDSFSVNNFHSAKNHQVDLLYDDGFLSDGDFEVEFDEKEEDNWAKSDFISEKDFGEKSRNVTEIGEKNSLNDATNKLESLWEHQELIEQLKMEIKKVKATGLPTICEESESPPKIIEDLKPWKIEEVYQHGGDKMGEVHKFYKSYRDRMRKFDIFNYQKMYAIGFLQLKDPLQSASSPKSSVLELTTLLSQSFATTKGKNRENEPTIKFIKELQSDLEVVYVGQMCLSWEILHWQYEKALDIWESDPRGVQRFNKMAGEFQQFQVLMQRFIEDEPFQGQRIQNYVKNRCIFRNLLQVPVIREDGSKHRKARSEGSVYDISSDMLVEIFEESIRIFWRFVRADKIRRYTPVEFQKPEDSQLFMELQKDLHKKERKLKEQLRSGNCILRKLRSCREEEETEDPVLYFFSQVDMKLVSRVLHMSRLTTDQLIWCHNKLSKVSFVNKKIHVEPSFFLFPC